MANITEKELKEHLNNLVNAIYALSPTRNYVLQLLELLPRDYPKLVEAYPELFKDEKTRQKLKDIFGLRIGENVEVGHGLGNSLKTISNNMRSDIFSSYNWKELQPKLKEYLNRELPNVIAELCEHKLKIAVAEPTYGEDIKKVLTTMIKEGDKRDLSIELSKMIEKTGIDKSRLLAIKNFLTSELGILASREEIFELGYEFKEFKEVLSKFFGVVKE